MCRWEHLWLCEWKSKHCVWSDYMIFVKPFLPCLMPNAAMLLLIRLFVLICLYVTNVCCAKMVVACLPYLKTYSRLLQFICKLLWYLIMLTYFYSSKVRTLLHRNERVWFSATVRWWRLLKDYFEWSGFPKKPNWTPNLTHFLQFANCGDWWWKWCYEVYPINNFQQKIACSCVRKICEQYVQNWCIITLTRLLHTTLLLVDILDWYKCALFFTSVLFAKTAMAKIVHAISKAFSILFQIRWIFLRCHMALI